MAVPADSNNDAAGKAHSRQDDELTILLTKLYTIQEDIGAKPKTSEDEKKQRAETIAVNTMGKGKKAQAKSSRFLELKSVIVDRLKQIHDLLKESKEKEAAGYGGDNAKELIKIQASIREHLRQAQDEWSEMDAIYKKEARKKKSKFSADELEVQCELVRRLHAEIDKIKDAQMRGYAKNARNDPTAMSASLNSKALYSDTGAAAARKNAGAASWTPGGGGGGGGAALTSNQQSQILQLEERDADFDRQLDEIGEGIQDLAEIAQLQGEEVARQSVMLDGVNEKMDQVADRMQNVNAKMKETLEEVGRSSDKMCVDIMCIVLAIGFGAVIYQLSKSTK